MLQETTIEPSEDRDLFMVRLVLITKKDEHAIELFSRILLATPGSAREPISFDQPPFEGYCHSVLSRIHQSGISHCFFGAKQSRQ